MNDLLSFHRLEIGNELLQTVASQLHLFDLTDADFKGKSDEQKAYISLGEYYAKISQLTGKLASQCLFKAQWELATPDWFDHRHHLLNPENHFTDYWTASPDNVLERLPLRGTLLDLCCGDGFYDFYFYSKRASKVLGLDINPNALRHAVRLHSAPNITYLNQSVLEFRPVPAAFDVVCIRGAIEHFSEANQQKIFRLAHDSLRPTGWFCGDTPARPNHGSKMHQAHEFEWADEAEMRRELGKVFAHIETRTFPSSDRTTLFWQCRKD